MENRKILIIEDEIPIADLLAYGMKREGYEAKTAYDGETAFNAIKSFNPDLILLDLMLPDISGFEICKRVTQSHNIPIIMLTAKSDITDKLLGLEFGADDYITKPFDIREVIARIKAVFRRLEAMRNDATNIEHKIVDLGFNIKINIEEHKVWKDNEEIDLTPKEYNLLNFFIENRGKVLSREQLLDFVWGYEYIGDTRTVDIHIQRLRKKLDCQRLIETVFGFGYKIIK